MQTVANIESPKDAMMIWSYLVEPVEPFAKQLLAVFDPIKALEWLAPENSFSQKWEQVPMEVKNELIIGHQRLPIMVERWQERLKECNLNAMKDRLREVNANFLAPNDADWPIGLNDLGYEAPIGLWVRGKLPKQLPIALVGARASSLYGDRVASDFSAQLAEAGATIISGGAFGIDAAAHRGALAVLGKTVAFMAGGVDELYPLALRELHEEIIRTGAIVSEYPPFARPARWRFLHRNRLIAAASRCTVVVEAGNRSGALATARRAQEIGRPVGSVPGAINAPTSQGTNQLLRNGATCVTSPEQIIALCRPIETKGEDFNVEVIPGIDTALPGELSAVARRVWDSLPKRSNAKIARLANAAGLSQSEVKPILTELQLQGYVVQTGPQEYKRGIRVPEG
ncbi:DNA protecting protein DprA [Boudabousia tangfeifanii]|uniref:DNA protecting protein DprA n=2 Tax=Boudabousia tangfeifanii TaxID=1912795 RepID=A0A1D9MMR5_9ACTO|nr:DNA protecting protein DprA [Boudabousia tangfeifanii]